jgi:hypothetical protein
MNKQVYIDKIAIITDELQQITSTWLRNDYQISELEVENYLSNIRYLAEQSALLKRYLIENSNDAAANIDTVVNEVIVESPNITITETVIEEIVEHTHSMDDLHMHISEVQTSNEQINKIQATEEKLTSEQTLHEKLSSQVKEHSIADKLKNNYFNKELTFSLNEKIFFIQQLFNGDEKDFNKVTAHLNTLESMEEVDFYLNATCAIPYEWDSKVDAKQQFYKFLEAKF